MPSDHEPAHAAPNTAAPNTLALNAAARALEIDPTRAVRDTPNAFTWWIAPGLRQRVQVEEGPLARRPGCASTPPYGGAPTHRRSHPCSQSFATTRAAPPCSTRPTAGTRRSSPEPHCPAR